MGVAGTYTACGKENIMIVVLKKEASKAKQDQLIDWLKGMGLGIHIQIWEVVETDRIRPGIER